MIPAALFGFGNFGTFFFTLQNYISEAVSSTFDIGMLPVYVALMLLTYYIIYGGIKYMRELVMIVAVALLYTLTLTFWHSTEVFRDYPLFCTMHSTGHLAL